MNTGFLDQIQPKILKNCTTKEDSASIMEVIKHIVDEFSQELFLGRVLWLSAESPPRLRFFVSVLKHSILDNEDEWFVYLADGTPNQLVNKPNSHTKFLGTYCNLDQVTKLQEYENPFSDDTYLECEELIFDLKKFFPGAAKKITTGKVEDYGYVIF